MAVFVCAGTLGIALSPTYFTKLIEMFGSARTYWAAIPGVLLTIVLLAALPKMRPGQLSKRGTFDVAALRAVKKPLTIFYMVVLLRSTVQIVFGQFLPLYLFRERGFSLLAAAGALTFFQMSGAVRRARGRPARGPLRRTPRDSLVHDGLGAFPGDIFLGARSRRVGPWVSPD